MTTMDSDSESQDSDDGRRFRFEATRKDPVASINMTNRAASSKKMSHSDRRHRDRKERSKHESSRKTDEKDFRYLKHSKHESWSSRQEDEGNNSQKDYRDTRGVSTGSTVNDRESKNSSGGSDAREKSREPKRQSDKDRSAHRGQRSREHSYERNEERASSDKHRSRYHEKHKHRFRDKSRERSYQSNRIKSSSGDQSREDHGKHESSRKTSVLNRSQNLRDYTSPKNVERARSNSETRMIVSSSKEDIKMDASTDIQNCKDLDLSQFDVLSETDENISDGSNSQNLQLKGHVLKRKSNRDYSKSHGTTRKKLKEEPRKVNTENDDNSVSGSGNNDVSESSLGSTMVFAIRETSADSMREKSEHCEERMMDSSGECSNSKEKYSQHPGVSTNKAGSLENVTEQSELTYGPVLPTKFDDETLEESSSNTLNGNHSRAQVKTTSISDNIEDEKTSFIGPCLPWIDETKNIESQSSDYQSGEQQEARDDTMEEADLTFGPALPPHLLQRKRGNELEDKIIGPVLPSTVKLCKENSDAESDDDCAIGPLPADHPALRNSHVHEQLDLRAQRIKNEGYSEEIDVRNQREEWMTELPSAQATNLGLGPRKFRLREGPDMSDRSCWTDTPAQKARKQKDSETRKFSNMQESETKHAKEFHKKEAHKSSKREKSLLEIHQSKMAKKKRKEEKEAKLSGQSTRRPFDRDIDLQTNRFDKAQKKNIVMKAQLLDDRFSRGQI